jgi:hypothetical protein
MRVQMKMASRLVDFAAGRKMAVKSTYFMHKRIHLQTWHSTYGHTFNQIDHCLIDGRHFSDVIDIMAPRSANIDSDHMLVGRKLRAKICRASNTKPQLLRRSVDLENDGVDIDLPSREEIGRALKYLKNNKAAGADSIAGGRAVEKRWIHNMQ